MLWLSDQELIENGSDGVASVAVRDDSIVLLRPDGSVVTIDDAYEDRMPKRGSGAICVTVARRRSRLVASRSSTGAGSAGLPRRRTTRLGCVLIRIPRGIA